MRFKKVNAVIRTDKLEGVEQRLKQMLVGGLSVSHVKGYGEYHNFFTHDWQVRNVRIEIFAEAARAEEIAQAIVEAAHMGLKGDGIVVLMPVEKNLSHPNEDRSWAGGDLAGKSVERHDDARGRRRFVMKKSFAFINSSVVFLLFVVLFGVASVSAQNRERYVVSAKAGGVNLVTGDVTLKTKASTDWRALMSNEDLVAGDIVRTGSYGRAEVLLNPGSYLRLAENSDFELTNPSLDSLLVRVTQGSALIEVTGGDDTKTLIDVETPESRMMIDRRGLHRINVTSTNRTELLVRKGRAIVTSGSGLATIVKDGQSAVVNGGQTTLSKFDKRNEDAFDLWSKDRAAVLVAANSQLSQRNIARGYSSFGRVAGPWGYGGYGGYGYRYGGLWVFNPLVGYHTFFPFYSGWSSPYGHHYRHGFGLSPFGHFGGRGFGFGIGHGAVGFRGRSLGRAGGVHFGGRRR